MGRSVLHWVYVFALGAVPLVGCSDVVEFQTYRFSITESLPDFEVSFSEGVEVCEADTLNCDTTDAVGRAELDVRSNREVAFTLEKEGYGKWVMGDVSDENYQSSPVGRRMYPHDQLAAIAEQLQTPYPWEGGVVGLYGNPGNAGTTFAPIGSTVGAVGESFYYDSATGEYSLDLEATTGADSTWLLPLADGGFTEVASGEQQFELGGSAGNCEASWAWPGDGPNRIRVPVREGYRTYAGMVCN